MRLRAALGAVCVQCITLLWFWLLLVPLPSPHASLAQQRRGLILLTGVQPGWDSLGRAALTRCFHSSLQDRRSCLSLELTRALLEQRGDPQL